MKLIAAMSGGVDSAVAAARAVEAGHDVIGVHLALAANPQKSVFRFTSGIWRKSFMMAWLKISYRNIQLVAHQTHVCVATRKLNLPQF